MLPAHFFQCKGDEIGYLIAGELRLTYRNRTYEVSAGDFIYINEARPLRTDCLAQYYPTNRGKARQTVQGYSKYR